QCLPTGLGLGQGHAGSRLKQRLKSGFWHRIGADRVCDSGPKANSVSCLPSLPQCLFDRSVISIAAHRGEFSLLTSVYYVPAFRLVLAILVLLLLGCSTLPATDSRAVSFVRPPPTGAPLVEEAEHLRQHRQEGQV